MLFVKRISEETVQTILASLPPAVHAPDEGKLKRVAETPANPVVSDWPTWSVWRERKGKQVWVRETNGMTGGERWFGPGDVDAHV